MKIIVGNTAQLPTKPDQDRLQQLIQKIESKTKIKSSTMPKLRRNSKLAC